MDLSDVNNLYEIYKKQEFNKHMARYMKERYSNLSQQEKELINLKKRQRINCKICGIEINKNSMSKHLKRFH